MVNTSYAVGGAAYAQPSRASAGTAPQASAGQVDGYQPGSESVSPEVAYADTASPSINPAKMDTDFLTLVAAGVCALVVFSVCCSGNQNGR